jgi:uncharacterized protein (TIRG00374 family)
MPSARAERHSGASTLQDVSWQEWSRSGHIGWVKPVVTLALYVLVFSWTDVGTLARRLATVRLEYVAAGIALYVAGQAMSAWKWQLLLAPVALDAVRYVRLLAFYFIGMFFNLFLPTVVGGDAVKAVLLARETGAPARATMSVFMERNLGLVALLSIAVAAAWRAPAVQILGLTLPVLTALLLAIFLGANLVLATAGVYRLVDRVIAATPLARMRARAAPLHEALSAYLMRPRVVASAILLSFAFQGVVIAVVFLNARALDLHVPFAAVAVFVPLISLASMIPVSVNGLGLREALYILFFGRLGASTEASVSLALLYLFVTLAASLPGGVVYALQRSTVSRARRTPPSGASS